MEGVVIIPLTQGCHCKVSIADADLAAKRWCAHRVRNSIYVTRNTKQNGRAGQERIHRVIAARMYGSSAIKGKDIDHINGDTLDNRRENLRVATHSQNLANSKRYAHNTTGFKGVQRSSVRKPYVAVIIKDGKTHRLGYFNDPEEAHKAYVRAANLLFGEFARGE